MQKNEWIEMDRDGEGGAFVLEKVRRFTSGELFAIIMMILLWLLLGKGLISTTTIVKLSVLRKRSH